MRILFDARVLEPEANHGIARHGFGLLNDLARDPGGHRYLVVAPCPRSAARLKDRIPALARADSGFEVLGLGGKPYHPPDILGLPLRLGGRKFDLVYSPTFLPPLLLNRPRIFTIHDLIQLDPATGGSRRHRLVWKSLIAPLARRSRLVLTVSEDAAGKMAVRLGLDEARIRVIGNGLDPAFRPRSEEAVADIRDRLGIQGDYYLALGNPKPHKNLAGAVSAFHEFYRRGFEGSLVILGAGRMSLPEGPGPLIRAEGLSDDRLAALLTGARAAVFPSLAEGFGLPPLEASACLCPAIVSDLTVIREVMGRGTAFFTRPGDINHLIHQMEVVRDQPQEAHHRAKAGRARSRRFTWTKCADRLRMVFDEMEGYLAKPE